MFLTIDRLFMKLVLRNANGFPVERERERQRDREKFTDRIRNRERENRIFFFVRKD